jgi:membrane-bound inhibitor of C-type lysozyme
MRNTSIIAILGVLILGGATWYYMSLNIDTAHNEALPPAEKQLPRGGHEESPPEPVTQNQGASIGEENAVEFACADGKSFTAVFARDIVGLTLSDGRQLELRQAVSGSGIRYLNNTETIEFRGKGSEGHLEENGTITYRDCKAAE